MPVETIPSRVLRNAESFSDRPAYHVRTPSGWQATSWAEYGAQVRQAGKALIALGLEPGTPVTILGFNRPEWLIFDVAAMAAGGVPAGIYTTSSPDEVMYVVNHSECPVILVENQDQWEKVAARRDQLTHLRHVVTMQGTPAIDDPMVLSWDEFLAKGDGVDESGLQDRVAALEPDGLATMIYTSGTTGPPKAVMLSNDNLSWTADQAVSMIDLGPDDRALSYLPLSHIAEQMFSIHAPATSGYQVYFAESIDKLQENLQEVKPTVFFAVPRVWEKFYAGVTQKLGEATGAKAKIAAWAQGVGRKCCAQRNAGKEPAGALKVQETLASKLVHHKVQQALGLDECRIAVSGAAPVSAEILEFFSGLGITVHEVYGQSEDTGPTSFNVPGRTKFGTVGPPYPGVDVKIADDGEIVVKGRNVFLGYYKDEAATKETLVDGWLQSGDLGEFDGNGFLSITGRKKDIIITAGGKNIAPKLIESSLKNHELISEAVVIGDRRKYLTALVALDAEQAERFISERGLSGPAHEEASVREAVQAAVDTVNAGLARVEQIKKFTILPRELSIAEGELTPTLKVKRNVVNDHFADDIEAMYAD